MATKIKPSGYGFQDDWDKVINNYSEYSGRKGVVSIIERSGLTRDTKDMLIARLDARIDATEGENPKSMDKSQLIKAMMSYVPKSSEFYKSTEKNLSALHTYELRDSLIELRKQQTKGIHPVSLAENRAIHAWYDSHPEQDKLARSKIRGKPMRRVTKHRRAVMIR